MIRRPPRSTLLSLHDALPISAERWVLRGTALVRARRSRSGHGVTLSARTAGSTASCPASAGLRSARSRSEEHTSELQSRSDLVCRLLLEKKNPFDEQLVPNHL